MFSIIKFEGCLYKNDKKLDKYEEILAGQHKIKSVKTILSWDHVWLLYNPVYRVVRVTKQ